MTADLDAIRCAAPGNPEGPAAERSSTRGRVLIVDDEETLTRVMKRMLEREHDVVVFNDAREALRAIAEGERFDVVLCDLWMPDFHGAELYRGARALDADLAERFVFITGGAPGERLLAFLDTVPNERLDKPFDSQSVRDVVRRLVAR